MLRTLREESRSPAPAITTSPPPRNLRRAALAVAKPPSLGRAQPPRRRTSDAIAVGPSCFAGAILNEFSPTRRPQPYRRTPSCLKPRSASASHARNVSTAFPEDQADDVVSPVIHCCVLRKTR